MESNGALAERQIGLTMPNSSSPSPSPRKRSAEGARQLSDVMELPFLLVASVAIGGGAGYFLDKRLHVSPVFTLLLGLLGFCAGMFLLVQRLSKDT
jgi:F0F1-type ATP synthase assembly protein I